MLHSNEKLNCYQTLEQYTQIDVHCKNYMFPICKQGQPRPASHLTVLDKNFFFQYINFDIFLISPGNQILWYLSDDVLLMSNIFLAKQAKHLSYAAMTAAEAG